MKPNTAKPYARRVLTRAFALAITGIISISCNQNKPVAEEEGNEPINVLVELLHHDDKGLAVVKSVSLDHIGQDFEMAGVHLHILDYWPQAKAITENDNKNDKESHAVELAWKRGTANADALEETQWIYQTSDDGPSGLLDGLDVQIRILPPGSHPTPPDQWRTSPKDTVQFKRGEHFFPVPDVGDEIFPGWTVKNIRTYEHALLGEKGEVKESDDANFSNRAIEITLASSEGSVERHLSFLDHPEITKGIHPALLPATRLAGNGASQSRLSARDLIKIQGSKTDRILLSANTKTSGKLTAFIWENESKRFSTIILDSLPAKVQIGNRSVRILQHRNRARSVVKWQRVDKNTKTENNNDNESNTSPALLITWIEKGHHQKAALPLDQPTPIRIADQFQTFRYRNAAP